MGACSISRVFSGAVGLMPGLIAPVLRADLGLQHWHIGLLVSVHFASSALASVPAGRITDRWGARRAIMANLTLTAAGAALAASLGSYPGLVAAGVLSGLGSALSGVGTSVAIAHGVDARWRTAAMVAARAGLPGMIALLAFFGHWAAHAGRWEWVPGALAVASALAALSAPRMLRDDRPEHNEDLERRLPRHFTWFPVAAFFMFAAFAPTLAWVVPYVEEELGATPALAHSMIGMAAAITFVVLITLGLLADRIDPQARTRLVAGLSSTTRIVWGLFGFVRYRVRLVMTLCLFRSVFGALILAGAIFGVGVATFGVFGALILQTACLGTLFAAVADRAPHAVARATSVTRVGANLGSLSGPVAFGVFLDSGGSYAWAWFSLCMLLAGAFVSLRFAGWIAPPRRPKAQVTPSGS